MFWKAFFNTFIYVIIVLPMNIFLPMVLASLVNQKIRAVGWFRVLYYVPVVTPIVVGALMWKMLYSQNSILSEFLVWIGLIDSPMNFLTNSTTAIVADRKTTRLNSSHVSISYAVFCLKKKTK